MCVLLNTLPVLLLRQVFQKSEKRLRGPQILDFSGRSVKWPVFGGFWTPFLTVSKASFLVLFWPHFWSKFWLKFQRVVIVSIKFLPDLSCGMAVFGHHVFIKIPGFLWVFGRFLWFSRSVFGGPLQQNRRFFWPHFLKISCKNTLVFARSCWFFKDLSCGLLVFENQVFVSSCIFLIFFVVLMSRSIFEGPLRHFARFWQLGVKKVAKKGHFSAFFFFLKTSILPERS